MNTQSAVLQEILVQISRCRADGPVVVFDVDSTLFCTDKRSLAVLRSAAQRFPAIAPVVHKWQENDVGWFSTDDLKSEGIHNRELLDAVMDFWMDNFFKDELLVLDEPLPGAAAYVNKVIEAGATACYLTGRNRPGMERGTRKSLAEHGFPLGESDTKLLMKPRLEMDDADYKRQAIRQVRDMGPVVAAFDNEPEMVNLFSDTFQSAIVVLVDTIHSPTQAVPYPATHRIDDFRIDGA